MKIDALSIRRRLRSLAVALAVIAPFVLFAAAAMARPGGGSSFSGSGSGSGSGHSSSGGSGHSSGGGGGGDGVTDFLFGLIADLLLELLEVAIVAGWQNPAIGLPVLCVLLLVAILAGSSANRWKVVIGSAAVVGLLVLAKFSPIASCVVLLGLVISAFVITQLRKREGWQTAPTMLQLPDMIPEIDLSRSPVGPPIRTTPRAQLERLREADPDFSVVLFEDHLALLFAEVHRARGAHTLDRLAPYVDAATRERLGAREVSGVRDVILGALRFVRVDEATTSSPTRVLVEIDANYTEITPAGKEKGFYAVEQWSFARARAARTRPPKQATVLECPSCGAPLEQTVGGECKYCNTTVTPGQLDWMVESITTIRRDDRGPVLTSDVEEQGTDLPTVIDANADLQLAALTARDPAISIEALRGRLDLVFRQLQLSWSSREWAQVRPFVSDNLFQSLSYWIEAYRAAKLRNVTESARINRVELARITTDKWFDAVTVRVRATSIDYVVSDDGDLVSGSRTKQRKYTEYWTLIRSVTRKGAAGEAMVCPSCGGDLDINMAGHCAHCAVKVTTGEFDWVLSRIEQDEVYRG